MLLFLLAFLGGALTIVSPCILPVLPFVFARADRPFSRNGLPHARRHGRDFRRGRRAGGGRRRLGRRSQSIRALRRDRASGAVRPRAAVSRAVGPNDAAARRARRAPVGNRGKKRRRRRRDDPVVAAARRRDRPALGAMRGADIGAHPDGRRPQWRERANLAVAGRLRRRRRDVARARLARRRADFRRDEALAWRRRMDTSRAWRRRARLQRRDRLGSRLRLSLSRFAREHDVARATIARQVSRRGERRRLRSCRRRPSPRFKPNRCRSRASYPRSLARSRG